MSNHRSVLEPVELSMVAVDKDRPAARAFPGLSERVLSVAGIYGPNASGKSNVLHAMTWLSAAVGMSLRTWERAVPREPFKFGPGPARPSTYEIEMVVRGVRYAYHLEVEDASVVFEGLYSYPQRRRRVLFEREGLALRFRRGLGPLAATKELLTPTTLALSAAMRFDEGDVRAFGRAIARASTLGPRGRYGWRGLPLYRGTPTEVLFDDRYLPWRGGAHPRRRPNWLAASQQPLVAASLLWLYCGSPTRGSTRCALTRNS